MGTLVDGISHVTSGFQLANRPSHNGIDIIKYFNDSRTKDFDAILYCTNTGIVIGCGNGSGTGYFIKWQDKNGFIHRVMHLQPNSQKCKIGDEIKDGQPIGIMGWSGNVSPADRNGTHVHYDVTNKNGVFVNPAPFCGVENIYSEGSSEKANFPADVGKEYFIMYKMRMYRKSDETVSIAEFFTLKEKDNTGYLGVEKDGRIEVYKSFRASENPKNFDEYMQNGNIYY